jgi:hypothetical protein
MDIRYQSEQAVRLHVLGGASPLSIAARLVQMSGRRVELRTAEALPCGGAVKIEMEDSLLLGEVAGCSRTETSFCSLIHVREAIPSMSDLARLVAAVMNDSRTNTRERRESAIAAQ